MQSLTRTNFWHHGRASRLALAAAALVAALYISSPSFEWSRAADAGPFGGDSLQEWLGGYVVLHGDYAQFYDRDYAIELQHDEQLVGYRWAESEYLPLVYPPFYYVLTSPLAVLPSRVAALVWSALMLAAGIGAIYLWTRAWPWLQGYLGWICLAVAFYSPLVRNLAGGQKGTLMLAIFTGTYMLLHARRAYAAGAAFGLLLFKPQLVPVLVLAAILRRDSRFLAGFATTGAALGLVSLALGIDVCVQYVELVLGMGNYIQTPGYLFAEAHSWQGFFALLCGPENLSAIQLLTAIASVFTLAVVVLCIRGDGRDWASPRGMIQFAALTLAALLISPHLLTYDMTIALLPILLCIVAAASSEVPREIRTELLLLAAGLYVATTVSSSVAGSTNLQISTIAMAAVAGRLAWTASMTEKWNDRKIK